MKDLHWNRIQRDGDALVTLGSGQAGWTELVAL
jgi:hypothetical protein